MKHRHPRPNFPHPLPLCIFLTRSPRLILIYRFIRIKQISGEIPPSVTGSGEIDRSVISKHLLWFI